MIAKSAKKNGRPVSFDDDTEVESVEVVSKPATVKVKLPKAPKTKAAAVALSQEPEAFAPSIESEDAIIERALSILEARCKDTGVSFSNFSQVEKFLRLRIGAYSHEVFAVLFLDSQNKLIALEEMFRGTLDQAAVYPREVAKRALELNARSIIISHNHPSGSCAPSEADRLLTASIKKATASLEVRLLDHVIVSFKESKSFAQMGIL